MQWNSFGSSFVFDNECKVVLELSFIELNVILLSLTLYFWITILYEIISIPNIFILYP
jgi:hypothetical protein